MCDIDGSDAGKSVEVKTIPVDQAVGTVLAHDITEIRQGEFKGRAFRKGHLVCSEDIRYLQRLGKDRLFVLNITEGHMHENDAAYALAEALGGEGVQLQGEPREGKINLVAGRNGILRVRKDALYRFNMLGDVMCATLHSNTLVSKGQIVAGTRAIPLVVKREIVEEAVRIAEEKQSSKAGSGDRGIVAVQEIRKPKAGIVITGNEVYSGRIKDVFAPVIKEKIEAFDGEIVGIYFAPDDTSCIEGRLRELIEAGADLLIITGGMSVDPDDVTRFAIRNLGVSEMYYGSAALPGAMFLVAYLEKKPGVGTQGPEVGNRQSIIDNHQSEIIPVLGIPACGMYHRTTVFDLVLPRILTGDHIGAEELAELGHGGLCLNCRECRYPLCPFGK